jgi:hypothetical protein
MTRFNCPDPDCPATNFEPLIVDAPGKTLREICLSDGPGNCGNREYPMGSIAREATESR